MIPLLESTCNTVQLRRLFRLVNGGTPASDPDNWGGDVVWVTPADLAGADGGVIADSTRTLTEVGLRTGSRLVPEGTLILSTRAPIGYVARAGVDLATNQGCKSLVPEPGIDTRFYQYVLGAAKDSLVALGNGTTFAELGGPDLMSARVPAPTDDITRASVEYLDKECARLDSMIAEQEKQLLLLAERRQAEIDGLLLHGLEASETKTVNVPWPVEVPAHWDVMSLGLCTNLVTVGIVVTPSAYYTEEGVPCLRGLNVAPGKVSDSDLVFMSQASNELHSKSILHEDDIVIVRTGNAGAAAVVPDWAVGGNAIDLLLVRPGPRFDPQFLEYVLNSDFARAQVEYNSVGALQAHFNVGSLTRLKVPCPCLEDQVEVVARVKASLAGFDLLASEIRTSIAWMKEHRRALITAVVTGEMDV